MGNHACLILNREAAEEEGYIHIDCTLCSLVRRMHSLTLKARYCTFDDIEYISADFGCGQCQDDKRFSGRGVSSRHGTAGENRHIEGRESPETVCPLWNAE